MSRAVSHTAERPTQSTYFVGTPAVIAMLRRHT
jgi:hypothetical protein